MQCQKTPVRQSDTIARTPNPKLNAADSLDGCNPTSPLSIMIIPRGASGILYIV